MNVRSHSRAGRVRCNKRRQRQWGGDTVEFALLAPLFFLLLFLILDMSILVYDQQVLNHAARYAARQGTLYWVDPADYDPTVPRENIRIRSDMIDSAVDYFFDNMLIKPSNQSVTKTIMFSEADISSAQISVRLSYPYDFLALAGAFRAAGLTLDPSIDLHANIGDVNTKTGLNTEADLDF